jgi:hypothetical protein
MNIALKSLLVFSVVVEAAAESPAIIGDLGRQLSDQERTDITRAASTNGAKPWLFVAQRGQVLGWEHVHVCSAPTISTPQIRKGPMALVSRRFVSSKGTWEAWNVDGRGEYAQVAIPVVISRASMESKTLTDRFGLGVSCLRRISWLL